MKQLFLFMLLILGISAVNAMELWNGAISTDTNEAALTTTSSINSNTLTTHVGTQAAEDVTQSKDVNNSKSENVISAGVAEIKPAKSIFENSFNVKWSYSVSGDDGNFGERSMYGFYDELFFLKKSGFAVGVNFGVSTNSFLVDSDYDVYGGHICPEIGIGFNETNTSGLIIPLGLGIYHSSFSNKVQCTFEFLPHFSFMVDKAKIDIGCWLTVNKIASTSLYLAIGF